MPFVHSNDMIQQLPPTAFDPALRHPVLPWTLERGLDRLNPEDRTAAGTSTPYFRSRSKIRNRGTEPKRKRLPQLLNNPKARGLPCDVAVQNTAAIMADDEKAVQHGEGDRGNREEIHRGDGFPMVTQKGEPTLGWFWITGGSFHPAGNGSFGNIKTEHEKFSWMRGAPQLGFSATIWNIRSRTSFEVGLLPTGFLTFEITLQYQRNLTRCQSDDGFGRDDEECLFPA